MEKVIARIVKNRHEFWNGEAESVILFFPERPANRYKIDSYMPDGESGEASYDFYVDCTYTPKSDKDKARAESLIAWYEINRNEDEKLARRRRLHYNDLRTKAWRR